MTTPQTLTKQDLLAALRVSGNEALATLRTISPESLARVCYADGWTGREVIAHLAAIEWTYSRLIDLARQEEQHQPSSDAGEAPRVSGGIDAYNTRQVAKRAGAALDELLDEFARNRAATIAAVETVEELLLAVPIRSAGGIEGPLAEVFRWTAVDHVRGHVRDITSGA